MNLNTKEFLLTQEQNPVGKEWRWKVDDPQFLIENAVKNHKMLVRELKGMPGVKPERFKEAATIRHCALSLVGEPIIYPHINEFLDMLHERQISTFLVTNAQFPDKIEKLRPVTQLYVSVDAATKESLKKIDRPLFEDFWERFLECFDSLAKKGQRTVFRLTLVKEWNMEEIANYGELVGRGRPDFVEIKGVTFCGTSKASSLRMTNVPFHHEVRRFSQALCETKEMRGLYDFACEHEHSCCVLLAKKDTFFVNGQWHTWINYDRFHELTLSGEPFSSKDYMAPTPYWALAYSNERGFDPNDIRFKRKTSKPASQGC